MRLDQIVQQIKPFTLADLNAEISDANVLSETYIKSHIGEAPISAVVQNPTVTETGLAIVWDNAVGQYTFGSAGTGESNTGSNIGTGIGIFASKSGTTLQFKSIKGGTGILVSGATSDVTISVDDGRYWKTIGTTELTGNATINGNTFSVNMGALGNALTDFIVNVNGSFDVNGDEDFIGIKYVDDYSANFVNLSLIHKGFADTNYWKTAGTTTLSGNVVVNATRANDGLIFQNAAGPSTQEKIVFNTGSVVIESVATSPVSGLALIKSNELSFSVSNSGASVSKLSITPTDITFTDELNSKGAIYAADYSANFVVRSLIDKGYADNNYWPLGGTKSALSTITIDGGSLIDLFIGGALSRFRDIAFYASDEFIVDASFITLDADGSGSITLSSTGGRLIFTGLPTSDPLFANQVWSNAGVLTLSAG